MLYILPLNLTANFFTLTLVEETGAHIDEEHDGSLNDVDGGSTLWAISDVPDHGAQEQVETTTINENDLLEKEELEVPETTKKKKSQKNRRPST